MPQELEFDGLQRVEESQVSALTVDSDDDDDDLENVVPIAPTATIVSPTPQKRSREHIFTSQSVQGLENSATSIDWSIYANQKMYFGKKQKINTQDPVQRNMNVLLNQEKFISCINSLCCGNTKCRKKGGFDFTRTTVGPGPSSAYCIDCSNCKVSVNLDAQQVNNPQPNGPEDDSLKVLEGKENTIYADEVSWRLMAFSFLNGIGEAENADLLGLLNMSPGGMHNKFSKLDKPLSVILQQMCKEKCLKNLEEEMELTRRESPQNVRNGKVFIDICADARWDKRGNGKQYNSKSGMAAIIGLRTQKCVAVKVYSMVCRRCRNGTCDDKIFCPKNYEGNSKGKYIVARIDEKSNS